MRVLQLHDEPWDSGIAHYAVTLSAGLSGRGHEVSFWARASSPAAAQARAAGLDVRELSRPWLSLGALRREFRDGNFDLVNAHTGSAQSLGAALSAGTAARLFRTCADARLPRAHTLARALARWTAAYIAANSAIAAHLRQAFPDSSVRVVAQGLPGPAQAPALEPGPVVGLLGRLDPVKGHEVLIEAAARLKAKAVDIRLRLAGDGRLAESLARLAQERLPGAAELPGRVSDPEAFIASCRIGCVPSLGSEAVSRAAVEWMALGRPVVASAVGGLPDIVEHGVTGLLVKPGDPAALAEALARLLYSPELASRMGAAARKRYEDRFALPRFVTETERVYGAS